MNIVFISFYIGFLIGCSTIYDISYDYDRTADFTILRSFNWLAVPEKSNMNSLDLIRIKKAVSAKLNDKGFKKALDNFKWEVNNTKYSIFANLLSDKELLKGELSKENYDVLVYTADRADNNWLYTGFHRLPKNKKRVRIIKDFVSVRSP